MPAPSTHPNAFCPIPAAMLMAVPAALLLPARFAAADRGATGGATEAPRKVAAALPVR